MDVAKRSPLRLNEEDKEDILKADAEHEKMTTAVVIMSDACIILQISFCLNKHSIHFYSSVDKKECKPVDIEETKI